MVSRSTDMLLFQILREIDLLPQLYDCFVTSQEKCTISLPEANYCRLFSRPLFKHASEFYSAFLIHTPLLRNCSVCFQRHRRDFICLPELFTTDSVDLLLDILEWKRTSLSSQEDIISLVRLCGYLMIKKDLFHAFLVHCLPLYTVQASLLSPILSYELYRNGFHETAMFYARSVDHPCFSSVLQKCSSYRYVKRSLRSYHRLRHFSKVYTLKSGKVKFSPLRAAFYFDFVEQYSGSISSCNYVDFKRCRF